MATFPIDRTRQTEVSLRDRVSRKGDGLLEWDTLRYVRVGYANKRPYAVKRWGVVWAMLSDTENIYYVCRPDSGKTKDCAVGRDEVLFTECYDDDTCLELLSQHNHAVSKIKELHDVHRMNPNSGISHMESRLVIEFPACSAAAELMIEELSRRVAQSGINLGVNPVMVDEGRFIFTALRQKYGARRLPSREAAAFAAAYLLNKILQLPRWLDFRYFDAFILWSQEYFDDGGGLGAKVRTAIEQNKPVIDFHDYRDDILSMGSQDNFIIDDWTALQNLAAASPVSAVLCNIDSTSGIRPKIDELPNLPLPDPRNQPLEINKNFVPWFEYCFPFSRGGFDGCIPTYDGRTDLARRFDELGSSPGLVDPCEARGCLEIFADCLEEIADWQLAYKVWDQLVVPAAVGGELAQVVLLCTRLQRMAAGEMPP